MVEVDGVPVEPPEELYTFYHEVMCNHCLGLGYALAKQLVPVKKRAEDIPAQYRERWVKAAKKHQLILWPMNVSPEEVAEALSGVVCRYSTEENRWLHRMKFIHAIGGGV